MYSFLPKVKVLKDHFVITFQVFKISFTSPSYYSNDLMTLDKELTNYILGGGAKVFSSDTDIYFI